MADYVQGTALVLEIVKLCKGGMTEAPKLKDAEAKQIQSQTNGLIMESLLKGEIAAYEKKYA